MRILCLATVLALTATADAQRKSLIFTGRFPFTSLDDVNERANGSITQLQEFDISLVTPNASAPFVARTFWLPTTAQQTVAGDAYNDRNYTRFYQLKTNYFERWNFAAPFVKVADQASCTWDKVFWTVRDNAVNKNFTVKTNNGTATAVIQPGDFFRFDKNGNAEFFVTQALIMQAAGAQTAAFSPGASAICQDAAGNLYYSPAEGGHYVSGNTGAPVYHNDASIMMIRRPDITYDARGNVSSFVAGSAICLFSELQPGPMGEPTLRTMQTNAGAQNNAFVPITITNNMVGLALDPNGGTVQASLPWGPNNTYEIVPNLIWTDDGGTYGATVFSTRVNPANNQLGSVAVVNGVPMGSTTAPATGAYWGVRQDIANFQPTTMGFAVIDEPIATPFTADAPNHGAILPTDTTIEWDFYPGPSTFTYAVLAVGPLVPGQVPFGFDVSFLFGRDSFQCLYGLTTQLATFSLGVSNPAGYINLSLRKPMQGGLTGLTLIMHGLKLTTSGPGIALSNPVLSQFK
jgi:hypothetical protein